MTRKTALVVACALGSALAVTAPSVGVAAPAGTTATPAQLTGQYWAWAHRVPLHTGTTLTHPIVATGAVDCSKGQVGGTWFLGGRYAGVSALTVSRSCSVPVTKQLVVAVATTWADNSECDGVPFGTATTTQLRAVAHAAIAPATIRTASVDGKAVPATALTTARSTVFGYTTPADSLVNAYYCRPQGKTFRAQTVTGAVAEATYFQPRLTVGTHVVRTVLKNSVGINQGTVTYTLTVTP